MPWEIYRERERVAAAFLVTFAIVLVAAVVAPAEAYADGGTYSYVYRWWDSTSGTVKQGSSSAYCEDIDEGDNTTISGGWYYTCGDDNDMDVVRVAANSTVNIIVRDGTEQKIDGIYVPSSSTLNIYSEPGGSGWLKCVADHASYAGIGGLDGDDPEDGTADCGTINIHGGNIYAKGDDHSSQDIEGGAGIGGGYKGSGGTIRIYGGSVEAQGNSDAAGVGGGNSGGTITISNANITAQGGSDGAGIGGGSGSKGDGKDQTVNCGISGAITINSGIVTAIGGAGGGSGIGSGAGCGDPAFNTVDVTVNGGTVTATAGDMGNEAGAGKYDSGVAIGAGGQYLKSELNNIEIDDDFAERK